jgi:predicted transglutaminase-like cysteine proteinase
MSAAACANVPAASTSMPLGFAAAPPRAYVDFCARQPGDCGVDGQELAQMRSAADAAAPAAVSAISYDWSSAFKRRSSDAAPTPQVAVAYDWSGVFAQAKANGEIIRTSQTIAPVVVEGRRATPAKLTLDHESWALLTKTNETVNRAIVPQDDIVTYGVADYWATPLEAGVHFGDCEDYVLEKRHRLIAEGVPASALSIAVVLTEKGETHAVLVVATNTGDYVLDNRTPYILPWAQTAYRWRERQVAGSASQWAFAAVHPSPDAQPHVSFLIASSR